MRKYFDKYTLAGAVLAFIAWLYLAPTATVAGIIQAIVPAAVPAAFKNGVGGTKFQLSDNSGNINTAGSITSGSGSGVGGVIDLTQGTAPSFSAANTFSLYAPTSIPTSYQWQVPSADGSGCIQSNGSGVLSITTCGGGGGTSAGATLFSGTSTATVTAASATTLIGTVTGSTTVPANTWTAGSLTEIYATGYYTTPAAARTLTINLNIGGSTRITTGAVTVIASVTNGTWNLQCGITTRTTGASGTQIGNCTFFMTGTTSTPAGFPMQTSSTWTMDTTAGKAIDLQAAWDATTGSPTISASNVAAWIPGAPVTSVNGLTGAVTLPVYTTASITPPISGDWTALGSGGTRTDVTGPNGNTAINVVGTTGGSTSTGNIYGIQRAVSAGDFSHVFIVWAAPSVLNASNIAVGFTDGTKTEACLSQGNGTALVSEFSRIKSNSLTTGYADANGATGFEQVPFTPLMIAKLIRSGTNLTCSLSFDGGITYRTVFTDTVPFLTASAVYVGTDPRGSTVAGTLTLISYQ